MKMPNMILNVLRYIFLISFADFERKSAEFCEKYLTIVKCVI